MDLANNRSELTGMLETLRPILQDSLATLTSLNIFGSASAEASYQHNIMLANNRATSAKKLAYIAVGAVKGNPAYYQDRCSTRRLGACGASDDCGKRSRQCQGA